jgi:mRNA interferase RelE/StbE
MYKVSLSSYAAKAYSKANITLAKKLSKCFIHLEINPYENNNIKKLSGQLTGLYRYRVGDYRVIFEINEKSKLVEVLSIKHRKSVYK